MEDQDNNEDKQRYFKCYHNGIYFGRFKGRIPKQAANKAFTSLLRKNIKYEYDQNIKFSVIETTKDSDRKSFTYSGKRVNTPSIIVHIKQNGGYKAIQYKHKNIIKREYTRSFNYY